MSAASSISAIQFENLEFPAVVTPPGSSKSYFLGGAGERGLVIDGNFIKFTGIGVYLEDKAVASLAPKWKGNTSQELVEALHFFRDIISAMATAAASIIGVKVEFLEFPAVVTTPGSTKSYFLGGAGVRGLEIDGEFVKFTGIGVYVEDKAVPFLAAKWKGKSEAELLDSLDFYRDIIKGPFEKLIRGSKIRTLPGPEYVRKVSENCVAHMKSDGTYTDLEAKAIEELRDAFKDQNFPPGSSVFYKQSPNGTLGLFFSKDETIPEHEHAVIDNKPLSEAVLETMIGEIPVSPALKESLATRFYEFLNELGQF